MRRNEGIDALRMCSMFMVVVLHVLAQGSILSNVGESPYSVNYQVAWFLETMAFCAVNCFALISGYVGVKSQFHYYKGVILWLQVVFWTVSITVIYEITKPEVVGIRQWIKAVLPVSMQEYWYVTSYFCMFLFIPFMNKLLIHLNRTELKILGITIVAGVSFFPTCVMHDLYTLHGGYTFIWLAMLYLLGGVIQRLEFGKEIRKITLFLIYIGAVVLSWGIKFILERHPISLVSSNFLINYTSPTMLICAVSLVLLFARTEFRTEGVKKLIKAASPLAFSVYIIHTNPLVWDYWLSGRYAFAAGKTPVVLVGIVIGKAVLIYIACSLADMIRLFLFKKLKLVEIGKKIETHFLS